MQRKGGEKMQKNIIISGVVFLAISFFTGICYETAAEPLAITKGHKCHACGMRVFDFINWHTQIVYKDGTNDGFCAVKCLMAFYFEPEKYSKHRTKENFETLYAKDYYSLKWHDMKDMVFVLGSDVMGPMGRELVPFSDRRMAETFLEDHNGTKIFSLDEITLDLIHQLRKKKGKGL